MTEQAVWLTPHEAADYLRVGVDTIYDACARTIENTGDPVVTQKLARHKDGRTTQRYTHARHSHLLAAAVRLNRR
jgi:integrase